METLIVAEKWCDLNPNLGVTSGNSNIIGSLECSGLTNITVFHYDEFLINHNNPIDSFLIHYIENHKVDALVVSYFPCDNDPRNISLETFSKIRQIIPVIFIWFDFGHAHIRNLALKTSHCNSLNVIIDVHQQPNEKFLPMWVPQDERIFNWYEGKDIPVSFVGSRNGYQERVQYLHHLGRDVQISGGQREHKLTLEEYAHVLKRFRITLNFPSKPDGVIQAKSRVYESMLCGALLMEKENDAIKNWFNPMEHYVPFYNEQDMVQKVKYYTENVEERLQIAKCGYDKMKTDYSSANWWTRVFEKVL